MIHVAVLLRPYVELILAGEKSVECRLTRTAKAPYNGVELGDRIYFKESSGPWRLTAIIEQVLFEEGLTPKRIREIRRDYNDVIRGEAEFWKSKRDARYLTLIWLREVERIDPGAGPGVRPLQGAAWLTLREPKPRGSQASRHQSVGRQTREPRGGRNRPLTEAKANSHSFSIPITEGNLRNSTLYVTGALDRFPPSCLGGPTRSQQARPVTLVLRDGPVVETDIVLPRKLFRARPWKAWFERVGARPGDEVVFTPLGEATWFVGHRKAAQG